MATKKKKDPAPPAAPAGRPSREENSILSPEFTPVEEVKGVEDLTKACYKLCNRFGSMPWFRGHSREAWKLVPSIHRGYNHDQEVDMTLRFRLQATSRRPSCPSEDDWAAWLSLMRHFGLPTRLLDWSESILVAAFFAVCTERPPQVMGMGAATIWAMHPFKLNQSIQIAKGVPLFAGQQGRTLALPAFFAGAAPDDTVTAVQPGEIDGRMMLQQSVFTIHGGPKPLEDMPGCKDFMAKLVIPYEFRANLADGVEKLGLRRSKVFPDLENLAADIKDAARRSIIVPL